VRAFKFVVAWSAAGIPASCCMFGLSVAAQSFSGAAEAPAQAAGPSARVVATENPAPLIEAPVPGGLSSDAVARRAADTSHNVRARDAERAAADAVVAQAQAGFIPKLSGSARYTRLSKIDQPSLGNLVVAPNSPPGALAGDANLAAVPLSFPVPLNQYSLQAQLQIPLTDYALRLPQLYAAAQRNAEASALMARATRLRVATDARVLYYNWLRARLQTTVAARTLEQARQHLADARAAHDVGTASTADVLRVESQLASSELQLARSQASAELYEQQLRVVMHDPGKAGYGVGEDLRVVPERSAMLERAANERGLIDGAIDRRLETRALSANASATRSQASAVLAGELPRLDALGGLSYANPNQRIFPQRDEFKGTWDVGLQLSWTPSDIFGAEANRSGTLARARQLDEQRADLSDSIEMEVRQELQSLKLTETALRTSERGVVSALESYRVRRALFQNGQATSVELTDAENEWSRAQLEVIGARIDRRIAEARLSHALGDDASVQ
jgi:outer membrane protein TolC